MHNETPLKRNNQLYQARKTRTLKASREVHRVLSLQPQTTKPVKKLTLKLGPRITTPKLTLKLGPRTTPKKLILKLGPRIAPKNQTLATRLRADPEMYTMWTSNKIQAWRESVCAKDAGRSTLLQRRGHWPLDVRPATDSEMKHIFAQQHLCRIMPWRDVQPFESVTAGIGRPFSPGSERDAEHESLGEDFSI